MDNTKNINLWQGTIITFIIVALFVIFYSTFSLIINLGNINSSLFVTIIFFISSFSFLPVLIYLKKKYHISALTDLKFPDIFLILIISIIALLSYIIVLPFNNPFVFVSDLLNSKLSLIDIVIPVFSLENTIKLIHAVILAPVFEELFFRGILLKQFLKRYSPFYAIIFSSILFAFSHLRITDSAALLIWGILFGFVYYKTQSITASILLHSFTNLIYRFATQYKVDVPNRTLYIITYLICFALLLYLMKFLTKEPKLESSKQTV